MTYRELVAQDKLNLNASVLSPEGEFSPLQDFMKNQSPIMKIWFVVMAVNMAMFLLLIH